MITCPKCDESKSEIYGHNSGVNSVYIRYRQCFSCNQKFQTIEGLDDRIELAQKIRAILKKVEEVLETN